MGNLFALPETGYDKQDLFSRLDKYKVDDVDWKHGRSWSLVYYAGDEHTDFIKKVYAQYFSENGAGPSLFPSLQRLESEVVAMVLELLGGTDAEVGTMTSGGTESILLAIRAYREQARVNNPEIIAPEILIATTVHPSVLKAAHYFGLTPVYVPINSDYKIDIEQIENYINKRTICIVASAPSFSYGVVDPISEIGKIAQKNDIGLHVDACLGSFLLPFLKKLGRDIPDFDFTVPGVTSISADLHKNGYAAKGASVVLYRTAGLRRFQYFVDTDWPAGIYASPTMQGTRPGGAIASAWASMMALGQSGYLELAQQAISATDELIRGVCADDELYILGRPEMNVFAFTSDVLNIQSLGSRLDNMGWRVNRINNPDALHMIVTPNHLQAIKPFLNDLGKACSDERLHPEVLKKPVSAILYGGTEKYSDTTDKREQAILRLDNLYKLTHQP